MATTVFGIQNTTNYDWDECRVALTLSDEADSELFIFKTVVLKGSTFFPEIPNSKLEAFENISYCGLRKDVRIFTGSEHSINALFKLVNNSIAG